MTMGSETTTYALDLAAPLVQVLVAHESANQRVSEYLYGVARIGEYDDNWHYYLTDHLGSVRSLVGADGDVEGARTYRPYGLSLNVAGNINTMYGFTGEQTDLTGLVYLRARMYSLAQSQFLSRDPWRGSNRQPLTLNSYLYALANPLRFTDPSGAWCYDPNAGTLRRGDCQLDGVSDEVQNRVNSLPCRFGYVWAEVAVEFQFHVYYTEDEWNWSAPLGYRFGTATEEVNLEGGGSGVFIRDFLHGTAGPESYYNSVDVQGSGRTLEGDFIQPYDDHYVLRDVPLTRNETEAIAYQTLAVGFDWDDVPLGSKIYVDDFHNNSDTQNGIFVGDDTGGAITLAGGTLDLYVGIASYWEAIARNAPFAGLHQIWIQMKVSDSPYFYHCHCWPELCCEQ
jgi:RHS repeat-associated protein